MSHHTFTRAVADYLGARPGQWVSAYELMEVGGKLAFRTRVSNARQQFGMVIENRIERDAQGVASSYYRYVPAAGQQRLPLGGQGVAA